MKKQSKKHRNNMVHSIKRHARRHGALLMGLFLIAAGLFSVNLNNKIQAITDYPNFTVSGNPSDCSTPLDLGPNSDYLYYVHGDSVNVGIANLSGSPVDLYYANHNDTSFTKVTLQDGGGFSNIFYDSFEMAVVGNSCTPPTDVNNISDSYAGIVGIFTSASLYCSVVNGQWNITGTLIDGFAYLLSGDKGDGWKPNGVTGETASINESLSAHNYNETFTLYDGFTTSDEVITSVVCPAYTAPVNKNGSNNSASSVTKSTPAANPTSTTSSSNTVVKKALAVATTKAKTTVTAVEPVSEKSNKNYLYYILIGVGVVVVIGAVYFSYLKPKLSKRGTSNI